MEPTTTTTNPSLSARIGFHFAGSFATGMAIVGGVIGTVIAGLAIGHCGESGPALLYKYRLALAGIGLVSSAVPGLLDRPGHQDEDGMAALGHRHRLHGRRLDAGHCQHPPLRRFLSLLKVCGILCRAN
jgi:hypothetical protein